MYKKICLILFKITMNVNSAANLRRQMRLVKIYGFFQMSFIIAHIYAKCAVSRLRVRGVVDMGDGR